MLYIGIDLSSAFAREPRPIDIAVLDEVRKARFFATKWPGARTVISRNSDFLIQAILSVVGPGEQLVLAIDGPQGLANPGNTMRACERALGAPGHTPDTLPPPNEKGNPFQGLLRSSIDLFSGLLSVDPPWKLAGLEQINNADANLWEVFPGAEWTVLANKRLPKKTSRAGRDARCELFKALNVSIPNEAPPTAVDILSHLKEGDSRSAVRRTEVVLDRSFPQVPASQGG